MKNDDYTSTSYWNRLTDRGKFIFAVGFLISVGNGLRAHSVVGFIDGLVVTLVCTYLFG